MLLDEIMADIEALKPNPAPRKTAVIDDYGFPLEESEWPAILKKTSKMEPIATGQGTHCCDETFLLDGCTVSIVYDYKDQSEPIEIRRYKAVEKPKLTP